jgi:hypothetical protein
MISGAQIRAARALLGIPSVKLAEISGVGWATIRRFENVDDVPESRSGTLERVQVALEAAGVVFLGDPASAPGVQLRPGRIALAKS